MIIEIIRIVGGFIISTSVGSVIENAITFTTPITLSIAQRVLTRVGGIVLTSMIAEKSSDWVEDKVKEVLKKKPIKEAEPEVKE
jgi:hypothetical protein